MRKTVFLVLSIVLNAPGIYAAEKYSIDPSHSSLNFAVKHMVVGTTRGHFNEYIGDITFAPNEEKSFEAAATIQADSIDTNVADRDKHLKASDFFDVEKYPTLEFKSKSLIKNSENSYDLIGDLTIKDVTKEIRLPVEITGPVQTPYGTEVIGLSGETTINRKDFGISFNKTLDNGGLVVDDKVKIMIDLEANRKLAAK